MKKFLLCISTLACISASSNTQASPRAYVHESAYALHTLINLYSCATHIYSNSYNLINYALHICNQIGVMPLGQPTTVYHQAGYGYSSGYTLTQHATNHTTITMHVDEQRGNIYVDIFSAMRYDQDIIATYASRYFQAHYLEIDGITRS